MAAALVAIGALGAGASCGSWMARLPGSRDRLNDRTVPTDLAVRSFGRWTCGAELPQGRATSIVDLMHHTAPGKVWRLVVDGDGFAQLQIIEHHGRARQGCWAELHSDEIAALEKSFREASLCDRPDEPRAADVGGSFDVALELGTMSCSRHIAAASLRRSGSGRRLVDDIRGWLDRVSDGSFRKVESFATDGAEHNPTRGAAFTQGRLSCSLDRETLYASGDTWMLDYSFQRGLLWRRGLEISRDGAVAIDLASFQNGARRSCTGRLTDAELAELGAALAESRPCDLKTAPSPADEDHGYVSVHQPGMDCRYRAFRREDLLDSRGGRRFDEMIASLVQNLIGPGGLDPFDARDGLLFEERAVKNDQKTATGGRAGRSKAPVAVAR